MTAPTLFRTALVALMLTPALAVASAGREAITRFSTDLRSLDGRFAQQVFDANGQPTDRSEGRISLKAPRQFRWEYQQPYPQLIVADGDHLWLYDPDLEQVTVRKQSLEEQGSPLAVLIDPTELERQFKVSEGAAANGLQWLELVPRKAEDAPFERARLGFDGKGLAVMEMHDGLGQRTEVRFGPWQRNPAFATGTFSFVPPPGTEVVGEQIRAAEVIPLGD